VTARKFLRAAVDIAAMGGASYAAYIATDSTWMAVAAVAATGLYGLFCFWDGCASLARRIR